MQANKFERTIEEFDVINAQDPHKELVNGAEIPKELVYGHRMSGMLLEFDPNASETLRLAARCQHIKRWAIPREDYEMDRKGYLLWRTRLKKFHGELAGSIMEKQGYSQDEIKKVDDLLNKRRLKTDSEVQALEDVVCLVFLKYYFDDFIAKHRDEEDKLVDIVQKTWKKMSEKGHEAALAMSHSNEALSIVKKALS
ncbi:DUF4202 domain-containing protein [Echinicola sp. 20G]|uniref:DUF4202 domain-containing protein n=1 Tax=Echinicola sp. 20G TaxID=2781961 RepID=UPI0019102819|nr:DUF4202 domain-containing protein [Echinicola sp. 20G]